MGFTVRAACGCSTGRVRRNNEDNFWFAGRGLEADNNGMEGIRTLECSPTGGVLLAVFDGMGGESFGEVASLTAMTAAGEALRTKRKLTQRPEDYLDSLVKQLNVAVFQAAQSLQVERMGSTVAGLYFTRGSVYSLNLGDSRVFRLRDGELTQLSVDHTDGAELARRGLSHRKPRLTQHLGIDPMDMIIEPHIAADKLARGNRYLICSDGVTDMVSRDRLQELMTQCADAAECTERLMQEALDNGGKDNTTAIVVYIA